MPQGLILTPECRLAYQVDDIDTADMSHSNTMSAKYKMHQDTYKCEITCTFAALGRSSITLSVTIFIQKPKFSRRPRNERLHDFLNLLTEYSRFMVLTAFVKNYS